MSTTGPQIKYGTTVWVIQPTLTNDLVDEELNDIQYHREDPEVPHPIDLDVNNVVVSPVDVPLAEEINKVLRNSTDPFRESSDMGIDIYLAALDLIYEILGGQLWRFIIYHNIYHNMK